MTATVAPQSVVVVHNFLLLPLSFFLPVVPIKTREQTTMLLSPTSEMMNIKRPQIVTQFSMIYRSLLYLTCFVSFLMLVWI